MRWLAAAAVLLVVTPSENSRVAAIGPRNGLPPALARALDPAAFVPLGKPGPNDWLASHPEPGQTLNQFEHADVHRPDAQRHTIYLQPLGRFGADAPSLEVLRSYAAAFFMMEVTLLPPVPLDTKLTSRTNPYSGQRQLLTTDLLPTPGSVSPARRTSSARRIIRTIRPPPQTSRC